MRASFAPLTGMLVLVCLLAPVSIATGIDPAIELFFRRDTIEVVDAPAPHPPR